MKKSFVFKILYYVSFVLSLITWIVTSNLVNIFGINIGIGINQILLIVNLILVIVFSIRTIKNKLEKVNIIFPISYLIFLVIVVILTFIMNNKLMIPNIHFSYYITFILFNYLLLNIYSNLSFFKNKIKKH